MPLPQKFSQPAIMQPLPPFGRYLFLRQIPDTDPRPVLEALAKSAWNDAWVLGVSHSLAASVGASVDALREIPALSGPGVSSPSTPCALWVWLRGESPGQLLLESQRLLRQLTPAFELVRAVSAFTHDTNRDLSGYEDGTENPKGEAAVAAAIRAEGPAGVAGSSYVAVQLWRHDFAVLERILPEQRDLVIGRQISDNAELDDAPPSAHVKRTAQESFDPEAFVWRRSMPWSDGADAGLMFVAFGNSFDAFEAQLRRMVGLEDGITDALFRFTTPLTGNYFWCPPISEGRLDLRALLGA
ncbi:MAG: Dyp-type peroxidase [Polyangiaceae bacterium]